MRLETVSSPVERGGAFPEQKFTIAANAKMFNLLSDKIYSDKVGAIVREISSNAKDAHIDAGKADVPFDIHLPNALYPYFSVRDYGKGLSVEDMFGVYTAYSESTKSNSNAPIGMFGVGAKCPFAYTDSFSVVSRVDGMKYSYTAYIGEEGIPVIALLDSQPTDEPSGLEVIVPVKEWDYSQFAQKTWTNLQYFKPLPNISGVDVSVINFDLHSYRFEGTGWGVRYRSGSDAARVIQGGVFYPVDFNQVYSKLNKSMSTELAQLTRQPIDLYFDMFDSDEERGCLDVSLSRESLSYDEYTCTQIDKIIQTVQREIKQILCDMIDKKPTFWEACKEYGSLRSLMGAVVPNDLKWKNTRELDTNIRFDPQNLKRAVAVSMFAQTTGYRAGRSHLELESINANVDHTVFVLNDIDRGAPSRVKLYSKHNRNSRVFLITISKVPVIVDGIQVDGQKVYQDMMDHFGNPEVILVSSLTKPMSTYRYSGKTLTTEEMECLGWIGQRTSAKRQWITHKVPLAAGGVYVDVSAYKILHPHDPNYSALNVNSLLESMKQLGLVDAYTQVQGVGKRQSKALAELPNWANLFDIARKACNKSANKKMLNQMHTYNSMSSTVYREAWSELFEAPNIRTLEFYQKIIDEVDDPAVKEFFELLTSSIFKDSAALQLQHWKNVTHHSGIKYVDSIKQAKEIVDQLNKLWDDIRTKHKIIAFLSFRSINETTFQTAFFDLITKGV